MWNVLFPISCQKHINSTLKVAGFFFFFLGGSADIYKTLRASQKKKRRKNKQNLLILFPYWAALNLPRLISRTGGKNAANLSDRAPIPICFFHHSHLLKAHSVPDRFRKVTQTTRVYMCKASLVVWSYSISWKKTKKTQQTVSILYSNIKISLLDLILWRQNILFI